MRLVASALLAAGMVTSGGNGAQGCSDSLSEGWESLLPDESGGVGIEVHAAHAWGRRGLEVGAVWVDKPAWQVLETGDLIVAVDGSEMSWWSQRAMVDAVRGPVGDPVVLTILRDGTEHTLLLERDAVPYGAPARSTPFEAHHSGPDASDPLQGCGVHAPFELIFDVGPTNGAENFRVHGEASVPAVDCAIDRFSGHTESEPGTFSVQARPEGGCSAADHVWVPAE